MTEIWKDIPECEGYQVSNFGRIRSVDRIVYAVNRWGVVAPRRYKGRIISIHAYPNGYKSFVYRTADRTLNNILVHRLVAKAFVPGYFDGAVVNHKDENKGNNRAENLEWVTDHENRIYGTAQERQHRKLCKPVEQMSMDGKVIRTHPSIREAARFIDGDMKSIRECCKKDTMTHYYKGYRWRFINNSQQPYETKRLSETQG